jgi:hypothetical protein
MNNQVDKGTQLPKPQSQKDSRSISHYYSGCLLHVNSSWLQSKLEVASSISAASAATTWPQIMLRTKILACNYFQAKLYNDHDDIASDT